MSASDSTAVTATGGVMGDIWQQHESQIRDLYQNKKKTLKQVKDEMEKTGFPKKPLSTWESKLRIGLKIRKKNKAADWPLIYRHLVTRLERPGKKQLKQPTTVRLDGKEIPFDEAWKEIRRSGAHTLSPRLLPEGNLPHGVEVRTPSPILSPTLITEQSNSSVPSTVPQIYGSTTALQVCAPRTVTTSDVSRATSTISRFLSGNLTTPWISLCFKLQTNDFHTGIPSRLLDAWKSLEWWKVVPVGRTLRAHEIEGFRSRLEVVPASSPSLPRPSHDLGYRLVQSRGNISISEFVSTSIYLLSNRLHDHGDGDRGLQILCSLFEHDSRLFAQLLQCELSTGRATWESLLEYSQEHQRKLVFGVLLDVGIRSLWLDPSDTGVLVSALAMNLPNNVIVSIVDYLRRVDDNNHSWKHILDAILICCGRGHWDIANMLIQTFDINAPFRNHVIRSEDSRKLPVSIFLGFVLCFDNTNIGHWRSLDFFLSSGADVDKALPSQWYDHKPSQRWYNKHEINRALRPTILDHSFRLDRSLFERLARNSKTTKHKVTKTGLVLSIEKGPGPFQDYVRTRALATQCFDRQTMRSTLDFLVLDQRNAARWNVQFLDTMYPEKSIRYAKVRELDVKVVCNAIQLGVEFNSGSNSLFDIDSLLSDVLRQLRTKFADDALQLLHILISQGADINEKHLEQAVEMDGIKFLQWLRPMVNDFQVKAAGALAKAASLNNFEAVQFLLQSGADPNTFINSTTASLTRPREIAVKNMTLAALDKVYSVQAIAAGVGRDPRFQYSSLKMIQFLSKIGARLVVGPDDSNPFDFLVLLLEKGRGDSELFAKVKFAFSAIRQNKHCLNPPAYLLELCVPYWFNRTADEIEERLRIFEFILDEGADVKPGSPLAALTRFGGNIELLDRVMRLGANLDAYTGVYHREIVWNHMTTPIQAAASTGDKDLVELFLMRGANVNCPARGTFGRTALQQICSWSPATEEEHRPKLTICDLLLSSGADVNAAPALCMGMTALQAAAQAGDIELTAILIRNGAHVNAPPGKHGGRCALDWAAFHGRLDVCKLLLETNALSEVRGMTGYDGAINEAQSSGHHAVASLIRDHLAHFTEQGHNGPEFQEFAEDYHIYGYDTDDEVAHDEYHSWWPWSREPPEQNEQSTDEESTECDAAENGTAIASVRQMPPVQANVPGNAEGLPAMHPLENTFTNDLVGYMGAGANLTVGDLNLGWENEPLPNYFMSAVVDMPHAQTFSEMQLVPNAPIDYWLSRSGTGSVLPQGQFVGDEWMLGNPFGAWAGIPDGSALWPQGFDMPDMEFGFPLFDPSRQLPLSEQLGGPDTEGQDAAERDCIQ